MSHTENRQIEFITEKLQRVDQQEGIDGDPGERFSAIVDQRWLIDVILVNSAKTPEVGVVLDIYERPATYNLHDDLAQGAEHYGTFAVPSLHDAVMRIASAVSNYSSAII